MGGTEGRAPRRSVSDDAAVEVRDLVVRYGETTAVDGLDLDLHHGRVLALLGPNGAGKTTTVEVCEGFRARTSGSVRVLGVDPTGAPEALRARMGVMPQGGGAYPMVRVREMLDLVAACSARPLDTGWLVRTLGLESCARLPYKRLSGGQQQPLSLACAVVGRPELVFLDEPTASLDPQGRHLVWDLVRALRGDGVAVLLTTHLMQEAEALADDVVIVDHGKVVAAGSHQRIRTSVLLCPSLSWKNLPAGSLSSGPFSSTSAATYSTESLRLARRSPSSVKQFCISRLEARSACDGSCQHA